MANDEKPSIIIGVNVRLKSLVFFISKCLKGIVSTISVIFFFNLNILTGNEYIENINKY